MVQMENWATQAHEKLQKEKKVVSGQKEKAMADAVMDAIEEFCRQEPEFAQAIVQGGTFADCMKRVATGVKDAISDLEAYKKAVEFYFPGAAVNMQLTIDLGGAANTETEPVAEAQQMEEETPKLLTLDLSSFF